MIGFLISALVFVNLVFARVSYGCEEGVFAQRRDPLPATADTGPGPFFPPIDLFSGRTFDMTSGGAAQGTLLHVQGRVLDRQGKPVPGVRLYVWQVDAEGLYWKEVLARDKYDPYDLTHRGDPNFAYVGFSHSDGQGAFRLYTVEPIPYGPRSKHIHFLVVSDRVRLFTELHFDGDETMQHDGVMRHINDRSPTLVRKPTRAEVLWPGQNYLVDAEVIQFDIVLPQ